MTGTIDSVSGAPTVDPEELAAATGTIERNVREWLSAQSAAGYVTYDGPVADCEADRAAPSGPSPAPVTCPCCRQAARLAPSRFRGRTIWSSRVWTKGTPAS